VNKGILAIAVCSMLVVAGVGTFFLFNNQQEKELDLSYWNNTSIKNFSDYKYIGAGSVNGSSVVNSAFMMSIDDDKGSLPEEEKPLKLVGITGSGACEEIELIDSEGVTIKQNVNLNCLYDVGVFTIASFSTKDKHFMITNDDTKYVAVNCYENEKWFFTDNGTAVEKSFTFIIDDTNGHLYYVNDIFDKVRDEVEIDGGDILFARTNAHDDYLYCGCSLVVVDRENGNRVEYCLLKISTDENNLKVEKILDNEQLTNIGIYQTRMIKDVDRFGNIIFGNQFDNSTGERYDYNRNYTILSSSYVFTSFIDANDNYDDSKHNFYNIMDNGILYLYVYPYYPGTDQSGKVLIEPLQVAYLDQNCKFVPIDKQERFSGKLLKDDDGNQYKIAREENSICIKTITFNSESPWLYNVTSNVIQGSYSNTQVKNYLDTSILLNGHIYGYSDDDFFDYEISSGTLKVVDCGVKIRKMTLNSDLNIISFEGVVKSTQKDASGYLDLTKTGSDMVVLEKYSIDYGPIRVYTITPIN